MSDLSNDVIPPEVARHGPAAQARAIIAVPLRSTLGYPGWTTLAVPLAPVYLAVAL